MIFSCKFMNQNTVRSISAYGRAKAFCYHLGTRFSYECIKNVLVSKELGTNVLELHFVMLANHDQNILVLFRLDQSTCLYVKLESSYCRNYCVNLLGSIDRELDSIDRKSCRLFFL